MIAKIIKCFVVAIRESLRMRGKCKPSLRRLFDRRGIYKFGFCEFPDCEQCGNTGFYTIEEGPEPWNYEEYNCDCWFGERATFVCDSVICWCSNNLRSNYDYK